jgi:hypothetical protein
MCYTATSSGVKTISAAAVFAILAGFGVDERVASARWHFLRTFVADLCAGPHIINAITPSVRAKFGSTLLASNETGIVPSSDGGAI